MVENEFHQMLVERFCMNKATDTELAIFFQLLKEGKLDELMSDSMKKKAGIEALPENENKKPGRVVTIATWQWTRGLTAVILLSVIVVAWLLYASPAAQVRSEQYVAVKHTPTNDAAPGTSKATLTLGNGNTIVLDSANNGTLARQGDVKIVNKNGRLVYNDPTNETGNELVYNEMETQRGGQYQLVLADGSRVWLNASSSIRFPTVFKGTERVVEITGEVYFEVTKNTAMPFKVIINAAAGKCGEIEVLGTHFNIKAYSNEAAVTSTLLEGSIKLTNSINTLSKQVILTSGQQARLNAQGVIKVEDNADVEEAIAWKNGMFQFNKASIEVIMRQMERWYDVDVEYQGSKPAGNYRGEISRNVNASEMLKVLQAGGIRFKIEGRKIIVMP
ncbi:MAG: FecR domain-containing protein [Ferruginibacter sp.]